MPYQSNFNALIAYKAQTGLGTAASGAGANQLRLSGGQGAKLSKAAIVSNELRKDGMSTRGRHGTQGVVASYNAEVSLGSIDPIILAIMRAAAWDSSVLTKTQADFTSLTTGANSIVLGSGNPITMGYRVGDVIRATGLPDAANNGRNIRIAALSSTTITTAETLTVNATPDTTCSITRPGKRIINPASLVPTYFTLEEYEGDIDQSTLAQDFVFGGVKFSMAANGLMMADVSGTGTGQIQALGTASSPYYTSTTAPSDVPFSVVDATIRVGGIDVVELTGLDLTMNIQPTATPVFGSGAQKYSPDVFTGALQVSMNITALRKSLTYLSDFIAETQYSLQILAVDNMAEPKDFLSIFVPNFTLGGVDPSAFSKQGGGRTQTISIPAALVGAATNTAAGFDPTMISFQTTAP
ncbi:hypothetical protein BRADO3638 [Bradyrhizobium sp. ORS 278]|uniref:phage tail tube protein n=1 Tax=Bradyrhizobium sp. (strain ORS 278) TaxID=114615 RepID=UPI0001508F4A|nr:phage tail tube protein [Bradyrhizobium sp. ORS 278]CAL77415.1 hypothetical protein BRADO3638 [Bradyrhizobium sp. ORS 278]